MILFSKEEKSLKNQSFSKEMKSTVSMLGRMSSKRIEPSEEKKIFKNNNECNVTGYASFSNVRMKTSKNIKMKRRKEH